MRTGLSHRGAIGSSPMAKADLQRAADRPVHPTHDHLAKRADPSRLSDRARQDEALRPENLRVFEENWRVYGAWKAWRQLGREGFDVARCTVARLMKNMGIQGITGTSPITAPDRHQTSLRDCITSAAGDGPDRGGHSPCAHHRLLCACWSKRETVQRTQPPARHSALAYGRSC